ncbi:TIM barrel protein [Ornithinimicrobium faecis]|uniref:TIM barrel protein n=1 Tax=Ornithinimicrobium faecis TaxID=2934158 RepID=A0ABY4YRH8_9MICO|nr:TIM barrel protein [Ornithinimicrobium sp. HY1793]USQ79176.1 TIM barrel protein [Ornithinimicrobium sp. HY1793]
MSTQRPLDQVRWVANLHTMFGEFPLMERPAAARAAGFREVEYWWPFDGQPRPSHEQIEDLVAAITAAEVRLTAMNLYAGNMANGDRGVISHPDAAEDFRDSVAVAMTIGARLGTRLFNVPYGRRLPDVAEEAQDAAATKALTYAALAAAEIGATVLVEPLSGFPDYPVRTSRAALKVIDRVRAHSPGANIGLLMDQYHLATNGEDVRADLEFVVPYLSHIQVADVPGRGAPGSADGDVRGFVEDLLERGYDGAIALEYVPAGSTEDSLVTWRESFGLL